MTLIFQVICAIFSGILSALAMPNEFLAFGSPVIGFFALLPLYLAVKKARSYKVCALLFALDALATHLLSSYWLANFKDFAVFTLGASAFGTACIEAMAGCLFFFPFCKGGRVDGGRAKLAIGKAFFDAESLRPLLFAAVRAAYEWAKSTGFLAYPWGVLSMAAFNDKALIQCSDIFGTYGISFLMAYFSACCAEAALLLNKFSFGAALPYKEAKFNLACSAKCLALCLLLVYAYGAFRLCQKSPVIKTFNAVLVQQNMDPWASDDDEESLQKSIELSKKGLFDFESEGKKADLVVWSEAVLRYALPHALGRYDYVPQGQSLFDFIKSQGVPFVIGGPYFEPLSEGEGRKMYNAALVFDQSAALRGFYAKSHLVPFAEVIPYADRKFVRKTMERLVGFSNGWNPGKRLDLFDFPASEGYSDAAPAYYDLSLDAAADEKKRNEAKVRAALPICFEDAFPDVCGPMFQAGAEVFINITDDSWSKTASAERQHFAVAAFRAVEYRTSLVRSTNAGLTAVVDDKGRVLQSIPLFEDGYLCAKIPIYRRRATVYSSCGDWFAHLILILIALAAVCKAREFRRPKLRDCVMTELLKIEF